MFMSQHALAIPARSCHPRGLDMFWLASTFLSGTSVFYKACSNVDQKGHNSLCRFGHTAHRQRPANDAEIEIHYASRGGGSL